MITTFRLRMQKILNYWRDLYNGIGRANMLIKYIDKPNLDKATRDNIYGQALFLRATTTSCWWFASTTFR